MDISTMFPVIGSIAVICFIFSEGMKFTKMPNKYLPIFSAIFGGVLGVVGKLTSVPELFSLNVLDAIATGMCSGLAASGAFSLFKNVTGQYDDKGE